MAGGSGPTPASPPKNEQTKSMQKYEKELRFKNRVLKEKEKAIFNKEMLKKLTRNNISMEDLKSEQTLTNQRMSKKHLGTVNSSGSLINEELYSAMQYDMRNKDLSTIDDRKERERDQ